MKTQYQVIELAKCILPEEIFRDFTLYKIEESNMLLHYYLDEANMFPIEYFKEESESKRFYKEEVLRD